MPADSASPRLADVITAKDILLDLDKEDRASVLKALMSALVESGRVTKANAASALKLVNEREEMGSTAIGGGVALPHARVKFTDEIVAAFALLKSGAGFSALDGAPVRAVFLILSPKDNDKLHVDFLRAVAAFGKNHIHLKALAGCKTPAEIHSVFRDYA